MAETPGGKVMYPQFASIDGSPSPRLRDIYLLSPRLLPPEVIAVAFAKTSRSPRPFREIASELTQEQSSEFHEKWVLGYGHGSVAEHAVLHLALENLSRLAIESLESNRLCSYTEKSTRYQIFDTFFVPPAVAASTHAERYLATCRHLFETYQASLEPVRRVVEREQVLDPAPDDVLLVVSGHDDRDGGRHVVLANRPGAPAGERGRGERIARVRPGEGARTQPEEGSEHERHPTRAGANGPRRP